jgi:hypothetical protein
MSCRQRDHDYNVEDRWEAFDSSVCHCKDERRSLCVFGGCAIEEPFVGVWDEKADQEQGDEVELIEVSI